MSHSHTHHSPSVVTVNPPRHKSFVLVSRPLVYLNVLNQANNKADAHISKISLYRSKVFQAPTKLHKRAFKPETFKVCAKQTDTHK